MNKQEIFLKVIRPAVILAIASFIIFLIGRDMAWSGRLERQTDFLKFTPGFSILKPQARIAMKKAENYILAEPIYFDLYLPRDFAKVKLEIEYKNEFGYALKIGPSFKDGWDLKPLEGLPEPANNYKIESIEFDLAGRNINNGKLRFIISIPGLKDETRGVYLKGIKATLTRPPIWQENLVQNILSYMAYVKNQH